MTFRFHKLAVALLALCSFACAQSTLDIAQHTRGNLPSSRLSAPGVAGLCLETDGLGGVTLATCAAGGGSGTVTSFSAGNLSPLFTTSVATATSTPALSFTLSTAAAHTFFGNNTASTASPAYFTGVLPASLANALHKWLNSYDAGTGLFTQTQPDYSDLTGTPTLPANTTATAHQFFTAYNFTTGAFTKAQPDYSDLTGTPTLAATKASIASNWLNSYDATTGLFTATRPAYADLTGLPQLAITKTAVASNWLRSYDSTTGLFTASQPAYTDITGTPTLPATLANVAHKWLNSYTSSTGLFTQTQPDYSDLTGTPTLQYQTVQDEGTPLTQRATLNFTGSGVSCADNAGSSRTDCTIAGGGGSTPTGTGFIHVTAGSQDAAATTVDVSSADITGVLAAADFPALTGDVTNSAGSLATTIASGAVTRAKLAADAVGWQFEGSATSTTSTISITPSTARKHYMCRLLVGGYSGGGGVARAEFGNASTVDTGTNYAFGGFNIASGTSTAPTVSGIGSGSTAQEGVPVSGSTTTAGRFVQLQISNTGAAIKYFTIETSGIGASAAVTPNLAHIAGTWNNTTTGIGVIQFKACSATTGTCTTVNFTATTALACWGRDDN